VRTRAAAAHCRTALGRLTLANAKQRPLIDRSEGATTATSPVTVQWVPWWWS
jgi:hypothetical protein